MAENNTKDGSIFELGILIGRLVQLGADNGIVDKGVGIDFIDVIEATEMVLENIQFKEEIVTEITKDLDMIKKLIEKYEVNTNLTDKDSDTIIKLASKWRRNISDELAVAEEPSVIEPKPEESDKDKDQDKRESGENKK